MRLLDLADLAADQWGLLTTAQARSVGQTPQAVARLATAGVLERLAHGVYRLAGTPADPFDELRAAWLALEPARTASERLQDRAPAVVSHRSAAVLHGLGDLDADVHEFSVAARRQSRRPDVRFHRTELEAGAWTVAGGLPVTVPLRTVADLAEGRLDSGHLAGVVRDAVTTLHVDVDQVIETLCPHAHRYGLRLGDGEGMLRRLLKEAGLPESTRRAVAVYTPPTEVLAQSLRENPSFRGAVAAAARGISVSDFLSPEFQRTLQAAASAATRPVVEQAMRNLALPGPSLPGVQRVIQEINQPVLRALSDVNRPIIDAIMREVTQASAPAAAALHANNLLDRARASDRAGKETIEPDGEQIEGDETTGAR